VIGGRGVGFLFPTNPSNACIVAPQRNERRNYRANSNKGHGDYHGNQRTASPPPAQVPYGMPMLHVPMY
jgi:hypothetical protein